MGSKKTYSSPSKKEVPILLGIAVFLMVAISYPIWLGNNLSNETSVFTGVVGLYADDTFYYLALGPAEMADEQKLLGEDKFIRTDGNLLINPIGNFIVFIAKLFNTSATNAFLLFRMIAAILLALSFFKLSTLFIESTTARLFGLVFFLFGSGYDGCVDGLGCSWSLTAPEMNMFVSMVGEYYIPLANAIYIFYMAFLIQFLRTTNRSVCLVLSGLMFLLGAVYIYGLLVAVFITFFLIGFQITQSGARPPALGMLSAFTGAAPVIAYYAWLFIFHMDDAARSDGWVAGPRITETFFTYVWVFIPALVFVLRSLFSARLKNDGFAPLIIWSVTGFLLTLIPPPFLPFQVQAHIGISAPLVIMTTKLMVDNKRFQNASLSFSTLSIRAVTVILLVLSILPNLRFYDQTLNRLQQVDYPEFVEKDAMNVMEWAAQNIPQESVVVVQENRARMFAGLVGSRVFFRNPMPGEKTAESEAIVSWVEQSDEHSCLNELLTTRYMATHVFVTPDFPGDVTLQRKIDDACLKTLCQSGGFALFELRKQPVPATILPE